MNIYAGMCWGGHTYRTHFRIREWFWWRYHDFCHEK